MTQEEKDKLAMFAGMAMQGMLNGEKLKWNYEDFIEHSFVLADNMLAEYQKRTKDKEIKQVEKPQTLQQIIDSLKLSYVNENITEAHFPIQPLRGRYKLFSFEEEKSTREIEDIMSKEDCLPANLYELLDFEQKYHVKDSVVAFGSSWVDPSSGRCVPYLDGGASLRYLDLRWGGTGSRWSAVFRFLAVNK